MKRDRNLVEGGRNRRERGRNLTERGRHVHTARHACLGPHEMTERCPGRRLTVKFVRRWRGAQCGEDAGYRPRDYDWVAGLAGQQRIKVSLAVRCGALDRLQAIWHFIVRNVKISQSVTPAREVTPAGPSSASSRLRPR